MIFSLLFNIIFSIFGINLSFINEQKCPHQMPGLKLWSDANTWNGTIPVEGANVVITKPVLLDIESPRLGNVTIASGGVLVFSPNVPLTKLTTTQIAIFGEMWIGSEDCLFTGNAEIFLIGMYSTEAQYPRLGQKFIGVPAGGTLEMHGKKKLHWTKLTQTINKSQNSQIVVNVLDDVSSWESGDQVVVASSSYEWTEAEVFTLLQCSQCNSKQIQVQGPVNYTHLGETVNGIDMRVEIGLLTRNIKVHGEMQPSCYANMKCDEFPYDTFGGQIKILLGFTNVHVEGIELYDVGQQTIIGSYPLHFHLDQEVGNYSFPPYFRSNSIHKSYSRCIAIHGTFGVTVSYHTAYDILGMCYFLEDGGEKNTTVEYNLAIGTRKASLIPADTTDVASFFISLPMSRVANNVAAGSDGHGFLYIFPEAPVGLSAGLNFLQPNQSMHTALYQFSDNVAHSNAKNGLYFDHILGANHQVLLVSNDYNPLETPLNFSSNPISTSFDGFTGYYNRNASAWIRSAETYFNNFKISESGQGLVMLSSAPGEKHLLNSVIHSSIVADDGYTTS